MVEDCWFDTYKLILFEILSKLTLCQTVDANKWSFSFDDLLAAYELFHSVRIRGPPFIQIKFILKGFWGFGDRRCAAGVGAICEGVSPIRREGAKAAV